MSGFKFDPSQDGLRKTLKEYEELALRYTWEIGEEGASSGLIWKVVNEKLKPGGSISRVSIIFAMNRFVDQGVLGFRDGTGKGGHHKIYYPLMDEEGYVVYLLKTMVESMRRDFPEETKDIVREFSSSR
jgi:predicted transcriptional regulator